MMSVRLKKVVLGIFLGAALAGMLPAGSEASPEKESLLKLSFSHRFRFVSWDNAIHLNEDAGSSSTFTRHRTSFGLDWRPRKNWELFFKVTNEFRKYFIPEGRKFNLNEFFVDNLYAKVRNPGKLPMVLTLGRQNIMLGEGFVVMDGHPLDGSRSIYFNAARMDLEIREGRTLTAFYTYQPVTDNLLPLVNDRNQALIEQPEEGIGFYYSGTLNRRGLDLYLIRKNIRDTEHRPLESGINTLGARVSYPFTENLTLFVEAALQGGSYGSAGRSAFGGYFHGDHNTRLNFPAPSTITLGGIYLSGDNPRTGDMEGWDPLFSRWPKWSESYIYTLIPEYGGKVAYWSNLASLYGTLRFIIGNPVNLELTYHHLTAPRNFNPNFGAAAPGHIRGELFFSKLNVRFSRYLTGHLLWEIFSPGDYYSPDADGFHWFRIELLYRI